MEDNYTPKKAERLITREEDESLLIFDPDIGSIKVLNDTAALIWNNIDGNTTFNRIIQIVGDENPDENKKIIREDVLEFLKELQELNYIED